MARGKQQHAPCKTSSSKNPQNNGSQLLWAPTNHPTYHEKEGATPHPGASKFSLQYDGRPDGRIGVRVGRWNLGSLIGNGGEVCEELRKRMIDVCCLQVVRNRRQGARMLGMKERRYKLWWSGKGGGVGGVGPMMKEEQCGKVVEVRRVSERVMTLVVYEEEVLRQVCGHAPQSGRSLEEKQYFYELKCEWDVHSADDLAMCLCDLNGHVGRHIDDFNGVHGGYCVGQRNLEGRMLLEWCV